ncbi:MAG: CHASE3 domain-containing protein [Chloroflexi bacterium]|nr:CHASE3 domain-containing protein [Chloroflexota bacterium]
MNENDKPWSASEVPLATVPTPATSGGESDRTIQVFQVEETLERHLVVCFGIALAVLILVPVAAVRNTRHAVASSDWVNHTHAVILEVDSVLSSLHAAEAVHRTFLLTGTPQDQQAYRTAFAEMAEHLQVAKVLTADDRRQQKRLAELEALIARRVDFAKAIIQARDEKGPEAARQLLASDTSLTSLREIRDGVSKLKQEENELLQQRDRASYRQARITRWIVFTGVGINFALLGLTFWLVRLDLAVRRQAAAALQEANDFLEIKVRQRTAELVKANEELELENLRRLWSHSATQHLLRYSDLIINSIGEGVCVVSRRGHIVRLNAAAARLAGWESKELTGKNLSAILRRPWDEDPIHEAMKAGRALEGSEGILWRKDGSPRPVRYYSHPMWDNGKVVASVVIFIDLSKPTQG